MRASEEATARTGLCCARIQAERMISGDEKIVYQKYYSEKESTASGNRRCPQLPSVRRRTFPFLRSPGVPARAPAKTPPLSISRPSRTVRAATACAARLTAALTGFPNASAVPWREFRFQHVSAVRAVVAATLAPATANKYLSALRGVLKASWRLGQIDTEDYMRAIDVPLVRGSRLPSGRTLGSGEVGRLFAVCAEDASPAGKRDGAAFSLLYGVGLRRAEAVALQLADYGRNDGALSVRGKGNRQRSVFASNGAKRAVDAWIAVRGAAPGPLLCPVDKGGRISVRPITAQAIMVRLKQRSEEAALHPAARTTSGAPSSATCSKRAPTSRSSSASPVTPARSRRRATTAGETKPCNGRRPGCTSIGLSERLLSATAWTR